MKLVDRLLGEAVDIDTLEPDPTVRDRKGQPVNVGDYVSFGTYPRGTARGEVILSPRAMAVVGGKTYRALAIRGEDGTIYGMPGAKKLLKLGVVGKP